MIKLIILALGAVPIILGLSINTNDGGINVISSDSKLNEQLWQKFKVRMSSCNRALGFNNHKFGGTKN